MSFTVMLPLPPSANNLFLNRRKGRTMSPAYRTWRSAAVLSIYTQVPATARVPGSVNILIKIPEKTRGDVDNRIKPIIDALVASRRIDDDRNVHALSIGRDTVTEVLVHVWSAA